MAARSPARFLAPLALVAVVVALYVVVIHDSSTSGGTTSGSPGTTQSTTKHAKKHHKHKHSTPRTYTVKPGDTPSGIAQSTGVPLSKIEQLNPSLDPQALAPGTKLKLK